MVLQLFLRERISLDVVVVVRKSTKVTTTAAPRLATHLPAMIEIIKWLRSRNVRNYNKGDDEFFFLVIRRGQRLLRHLGLELHGMDRPLLPQRRKEHAPRLRQHLQNR